MALMKKSQRKMIDLLASWLLVVGGLNWGLGLFDINLVQILANYTAPVVGTIVYGAVGISALWVGGRALMGKLMK